MTMATYKREDLIERVERTLARIEALAEEIIKESKEYTDAPQGEDDAGEDSGSSH